MSNTSRPSTRKAIDDMCKECIYDGSGGSGTWREQVGNCPCVNCPLYLLRPLPQGKKHPWQVEQAKKYAEDVASGKRKPIKPSKKGEI